MKEGEYRPLDALSVSLYKQGEPLEEVYDDEELFDVFGTPPEKEEPLKLVKNQTEEPPFDDN
jgi:hypothetical protein